MEFKQSAHFLIRSDIVSADEISDLVGLVPDKCWRPGDLCVPAGTIKQKDHGWVLESTRPPHAPTAEHVRELLDRLGPVGASVASLSNCKRLLMCVIYLATSTPEFHLDHALITQIDALNADFAVDLYLIAE